MHFENGKMWSLTKRHYAKTWQYELIVENNNTKNVFLNQNHM